MSKVNLFLFFLVHGIGISLKSWGVIDTHAAVIIITTNIAYFGGLLPYSSWNVIINTHGFISYIWCHER